MARRFTWFFTLGLLVAGCQHRHAQLVREAPLISHTVVDDTGTQLRLAHSPTRIVCLTPNLTEMLCAIGAGHLIVGASETSDYPDSIRQRAIIRTYPALDVQTLTSLKPDIVLATDEVFASDLREVLRGFGIPVYFQRYSSMQDIYTGLRKLGQLTGHQHAADSLADVMTATDQQLRAMTKGQPLMPTAVLIGTNPLQSVGRRSYLNDLISMAGGKNIFDDLDERYPNIVADSVARRRALVLLLPTGDTQYLNNLIGRYPILEATPAVPEEKSFQIDPKLYFRPGPRILQAAGQLTKILHPTLNVPDVLLVKPPAKP